MLKRKENIGRGRKRELGREEGEATGTVRITNHFPRRCDRQRTQKLKVITILKDVTSLYRVK